MQLTKKRRDYAEGVAIEVLEPSPVRTEPVDEAYLSTSPWQIMTFRAEETYKQDILNETFARAQVHAPVVGCVQIGGDLHYRNKMEYSFWGDDDGLHLALFHRASHGKRIIQGSSIARPEIDKTANKICSILNDAHIRASQLKTVVLRCNQAGDVVVALFVKDPDFPELPDLAGICKGVGVFYSNPKSPASVLTKELYVRGDITLTDTILDTQLTYSVHSFFQVNLPVFEQAALSIKNALADQDTIVDMYAGVGGIGLAVGAKTLVELGAENCAMAAKNAGSKAQVVQASTEQALKYITHDAAVIFDPPRAGLHHKVVERVLEALPPKIAYLSCNPATQARDIALLQDAYALVSLTGYNFFPRTPHIESLAILERK